MTSPAALLRQAIQAADDDQPPPTEVLQWLGAGLTAYCQGADLESALGLRHPVESSHAARNRQLLQQRDQLIYEAWRLIPKKKGWSRSKALAEKVRHFNSRLWPSWEFREEAPEVASEIQKLLHRAFRLNPRKDFPLTARAINGIVKKVFENISQNMPDNSTHGRESINPNREAA